MARRRRAYLGGRMTGGCKPDACLVCEEMTLNNKKRKRNAPRRQHARIRWRRGGGGEGVPHHRATLDNRRVQKQIIMENVEPEKR
jgi:hypothetical protein